MKDLVTWFGFKRRPFDKSIKTSKLLETEPAKECAARLDFIKRRGGIMLLTGDPGVGKTVALRRFRNSLNESLFRPVYTPLTTLKGTDILRHLNEKLGLPLKASKSALFGQLQRDVLESKEQRGRTVVMIIDEAHLLQSATMQELRLLTNFKMDSYDPFILILAGQTDLRQMMEYAILEPFAQRLAMRYHMPPLNVEETGLYITHHIALAGGSEPLFNQPAVRAIYDASYGIPRRIGLISDRALTYAMFADKRTVDADIVVASAKGQ